MLRADDALHPVMVARCIVISHNGEHSLAYADVYGIGEPLGLHHYSNGGQLQVTPACHEYVEHYIGYIEQQGKTGGGDSHRHKGLEVGYPQSQRILEPGA